MLVLKRFISNLPQQTAVRRRFLILLFVLFCIPATVPCKTRAAETHKVSMRDGVRLATDVYLPEGDGPWPVIFLRFPYNKATAAGIGPEAARRGYVFVAQDTRGRFASEGANLPFDADGQADGQWDGFDSAEWIARQPWCNGRIGTWGGSAGAVTQYLLAGTGHPAIVSQHLVVGSGSLFRDSIYRGGIFRKAMIEDWLKSTKYDPQALQQWTSNHLLNSYWKDREINNHYSQVRAVGVHIGGWYDIFAQATLDAFLGYQLQGADGARGRQKLIMGPWTHGVLQTKAGELKFPGGDKPPGTAHDSWAWFDATLRNQPNSATEQPAITYYVMGAANEPGAPGNEWRTAAQWPPVATESLRLQLNPDHTASLHDASAAGTSAEESSAAGTLSYRSDPSDPVPSIGGYELTIPSGPRDQQPIESRKDLLVFTTRPLEEPLEVTGHVTASIRLKSTAPDADMIVRLCDVYPDGRSFNITEGALRLRFRDDPEQEKWMVPGQEVTVQIRMWPTSMIFNNGHRLRVHIASSSSPALEPNLQNGQPPRTGDPVPAEISVLLGDRQSHLLLPMVPQQEIAK